MVWYRNGTMGDGGDMEDGCSPVKTSSIGPCAMSLELPPLVRSGNFFFFVFLCLSEGLSSSPFAVFFAPFPE